MASVTIYYQYFFMFGTMYDYITGCLIITHVIKRSLADHQRDFGRIYRQ